MDELEVAESRTIPNANNGHKGKVFIQFAFSFFGHGFRYPLL